MGRSNLDLLVKQHFYKHVLDITGERIFHGRKIDFKNSTYNFYYVLSLYMIGRFDESLEHCQKCIEKYEGCEKDIGNFYDVLSYIYFRKGDYHRYFSNELFQKISNKRYLSKGLYLNVLPTILYDQKGINLFETNSKALLNHIEKKHGDSYFVDSEKVLSIVSENFSKAQKFYSGYHIIKAFKCDGVAIGPSHVMYNYLLAVSKTDCPDSIITIYPIQYPGDLTYSDITDEYNNKMESFNAAEKKEFGSRQRERFNKRQASKSK